MKKLLLYKEVVGVLVVWSIVLLPLLVTAQTGTSNDQADTVFTGEDNADTVITTGQRGDRLDRVHRLENPLSVNSFCSLILKLLEVVILIGIPIAILFIVWAGFKFVVAQGKPQAIADARRNFLNVIIGIAIFVGASLIANVIINTLRDLGVQGLNSC